MIRHLLPLFLLNFSALSAEPLKIVTIGDSLTDGYGEVAEIANVPYLSTVVGPSIYPQPDAPSENPRSYNWPELLSIFRSDQASFGIEDSWLDLRVAGFQRNFAIVGTTTLNWYYLFESEFWDFGSSDDDFPAASAYYLTKSSLLEEIETADVVVIFLGGNDLKNDYNDLFNAEDPSIYLDPIFDRLVYLHHAVRAAHASIPIVVATVPDIGATPQIYQTYNVPLQQEQTRASIAALNEEIFTSFEAESNTAVARVDHLTDLVFDLSPFHLNGTVFTVEGDPYNPPDHLFTKDNFHPNTAAQGLIANEIITAINSLVSEDRAITPFSYRDILRSLLQLDPDQPYVDWAANFSLPSDSFEADSDGDGLGNGVEMLLGSSPLVADRPLSGTWSPNAAIHWTPQESAERYLLWELEESSDLLQWAPVAEDRLTDNDGTFTASPLDNPQSFVR
ncbi:MAG: SGNH/GDSL hydrolase family protein, partial [Verrucomicrobiales bacterium]